MQLASIALILLLFAMLFAIITQRIMLSDSEVYEPLKKKIVDVGESLSDMRENIVHQLETTGEDTANAHEGLVDWMKGMGKNISEQIMHKMDDIGVTPLDVLALPPHTSLLAADTPVQYSPPPALVRSTPYIESSDPAPLAASRPADPPPAVEVGRGAEGGDVAAGESDGGRVGGRGRSGRGRGGRGRGGKGRGGRGRGGGRAGADTSPDPLPTPNSLNAPPSPRLGASQGGGISTTSSPTPGVAVVPPSDAHEPDHTPDLFHANSRDAHKEAKMKTVLDDPTYVSPRKGTDISFDHQLSILRCPNQSKCIVPELQLVPKLKIYFCKHPVRQGVRFYFITKEGFLLHPNVELLPFESIATADFIVYLPGSAPWHRTECNDSSMAQRLIVMDEFDGHSHFMPFSDAKDMLAAGYKPHPDDPHEFLWYNMYFKRSYVVRRGGIFQSFPHLNRPDFYPITYSLAEAYIRPQFNFKREMEIVCTLRGSKVQPARQRVQTWMEEYVKERAVERAVVGQVIYVY